MKHPRLEALARRMREHQRHHPLPVSAGGLYIPHVYEDTDPDRLSHWDDVGFVINRRQFLVWWRHPRDVYRCAIEDLAWQQHQAQHCDTPAPNLLTADATTLYKQVGKSGQRKKPVGVQSGFSSADQAYYASLSEREQALRQTGIDLQVQPSWSWKRYPTYMGMNLVTPVEVRNERELAQMAQLARQLVLRQTTLAEQFPGGAYGQSDWLNDLNKMRP